MLAKACFAGGFGRYSHHINGVFAADIMGFARTPLFE
jgi:hypothetical protein